MSVDIEDRLVATEAVEQDGRAPSRRPGLLARLWALPVATHAAALFVVLVSLVPFVGTRGIFSADEGAAIIQARQLARGDGWTTPYGFTKLDPRQRAFPLEYADAGSHGSAAYAKHPVYPVLLAAADRIGGPTGMALLSIAGTAVAALFAGLLALRWSPGVARPSVWVVGLGSPLLFDSYLTIAHSLGAAAVTIAVWSALRYLDDGHRRDVALLIGAVVAAAALRSEAMIFAAAFAGAMFLLAGARRIGRAAPCGAVVLVAALAVRWLEPRLVRQILRAPTVASRASSLVSHGLVDDRWHAFVTTWLTPAYGSTTGQSLLVPLALLVALAVLMTRRGMAPRVVAVVVAAAVACASVLALSAPSPVPGLLLVFPVLVAGAVALDRRAFSDTTPVVLGSTWVLFCAGVLLTQYRVGGNGEWGGRYFALALPLIVPVALDLLHRLSRTAKTPSWELVVAGLVVVSAAVGIAAVRELRASHERADAVTSAVERMSAATTAGDGGQPVIVTTEPVFPRTAWRMFPTRRLMLPPTGKTGAYLERLHRAGVRELTLVTRDPALRVDRLSPSYRAVRVTRLGRGTNWRFVVLRSDGGGS